MMSRGFVKEDDQEEVPFIAPRADLPVGTDNFVTEKGLEMLLNEKQALLKDLDNLDASQEREYRIAYNFITAKLQLLNDRIGSAKVIDPKKLPKNEVHFGSKVTFKNLKLQKTQTFQIVGVDEADVKEKKISFITPLAKMLMRKKVGELSTLKLGTTETEFEIIEIE